MFEWAFAARSKAGNAESGDVYVVKETAGGVMVAVIDGIGHGKEAAAAARLAQSVVDRYSNEPVISLLQRCHKTLLGTRGVVMSLASIDMKSNVIRWVAVGNVQGVLLSRRACATPVENSLLLRAGVVGVQFPAVEVAALPINRDDMLVFATDGIKAGFDRSVACQLPPQVGATNVLSQYGDTNDDALVLIGRYLGGF